MPGEFKIREQASKVFSGRGAAFCDWIWTLLPSDVHRFDKIAVEADLELLTYAERIGTITSMFGIDQRTGSSHI